MIICYQYKVFDVRDGSWPPRTVFARNKGELLQTFIFGKDGAYIAICGWKIKNNQQ